MFNFINQKVSAKIISLSFGVLVITFAIVFYAVAWTEPIEAPPGGNVDAPLNVGPDGQSKSGGLILNTGGAVTGLIIDQGEVCIGANCRDSWPATGAITTYNMTVSSYNVGGYAASKNVSYACPDGSTPSVTYCKSIQVYNPIDENYIDACNCNGSTLKAYATKNRYCNSWPANQITMVDSCSPSSSASCETNCLSSAGTCEIEFTCGSTETVGNYSSETCTTGNYFPVTGGACNETGDDSQCNSKCTSVGWDHGESVDCSANWTRVQQYLYSACGLQYRDGTAGYSSDHHMISCRCWND